MSDKYPAKLDHFDLDCESLDDSIEKAIARYEYPFRDGADTDDMGEKARVVRIRCYFLNERYQAHIELLEYLKQRELFELSHPQYGLMDVRIESISIRHDDRAECAEIDLACVQDLTNQEQASVAYLDLGPQIEAAMVAAITDQQTLMAADMTAALGPEGLQLAAIPIDPTLPILAQVSGLSAQARSYIRAIDAAVATFDAARLDILQPVNTLISTISFAESIPGRVIGSVTRAAERIVVAAESLRDFPKRFLSTVDNELLQLRSEVEALSAVVGIPKVSEPDRAANAIAARSVSMAAAAALSLAAAEILVEEQSRRDADRRVESSGSGSTGGDLMTVRDLELSLATVRTAIQRSLDSDRNQPQLRVMALDLLTHVSDIKIEREQVYRTIVDHPVPLPLLCHMRGLSYRAASRVLALNPDIAEPNFISGEIEIYRSTP